MENNLIQELIAPITTENPVGVDISYDEDFTLLRTKRNADEGLSLGIWQVLESPEAQSKADKRSVYDICINILKKKSKNLQICAFLLEDIVKRESLAGVELSLNILLQLCEKYWEQLYPIDGEDLLLEERKKIFEWIDEKCSFALKTSTLFKETLKENICFDDIEKINRMGNYSARQAYTIPADKEKKYNLIMSRLTEQMIEKELLKPIQNLFSMIEELKELLNEKFNDKEYYLPILIHTLEDMEGFFSYRMTLISKEKAQEVQQIAEKKEQVENVTTSEKKSMDKKNISNEVTRDLLYAQISDLAMKLKEKDIHSPVPDLILKALSWKDLSFLQISQQLRIISPFLDLLEKKEE